LENQTFMKLFDNIKEQLVHSEESQRPNHMYI